MNSQVATRDAFSHKAVKAGRLATLVWAAMTVGRCANSGEPEATNSKTDPAAIRHRAVLELEPVGYWPADDGEGDALRDLSKTANPAVIHHVPWDREKKLLDFTSAYQWLEIPKHSAYQSDAFTLGSWFFSRSRIEGSGIPPQGMLLIGNRRARDGKGIQIFLRPREMIEVVSDGVKDSLGTLRNPPASNGRDGSVPGSMFPNGVWQHVLVTFEPAQNQNEAVRRANRSKTARATSSNGTVHPQANPTAVCDGDSGTFYAPGAAKQPNTTPWIQLDFPQETNVNVVRLVGAPAASGSFEAGKLTLSNGRTIKVPKWKDEWETKFDASAVWWIKYEADADAANPGLAEFEVYNDSSLAPAPKAPTANPGRGDAVAGKATLYLNGQVAKSSEGILYRSIDSNIRLGSDAVWWSQQTKNKSGSLDGAIRDVVWFDRALSSTEIGRLHEATIPSSRPRVYDDRMVILDGEGLEIDDISRLPPLQRRRALRFFEKKDAALLRPLEAALVPIATAAIDDPQCRLPSVQLLVKLGGHSAKAVLDATLPRLIAVVTDAALPEGERAEAALALAAIGKDAAFAVVPLAETLEKEVPPNSEHMPRVEQRLRNALTKALLTLHSSDPHSQHALCRTWAKPLLDACDLSRAMSEQQPLAPQLRELVGANKLVDAALLYARFPAELRDHYFTHKDAYKDGDYTATARYNGSVFKVGTGRAWEGVEKVPSAEYEAIVSRLAAEFPDAQTWRDSDYEHLYRVPITKITPDGREQRVYLEGRDFILDGSDEKCRGWSIFVDGRGYVHVMGGQHNAPDPKNYLPGSWEKIGISRDRQSATHPLQMYWISREPESIDTLEFAGRRNDPRAIPAGYLNYMVFVQSPRNDTFLYGRSAAYGWQCWGMFRHDASKSRWHPVGGDPYEMLESARQAHPEWFGFLHDQLRGAIPTAPSNIQRLVWDWQPAFYQFCRDHWGAKFDKTGRLHVRMQIAGLDGKGYNRLGSVYAWSDDGGKSFHRADGSPVKLPLTTNPAPEHNADLEANDSRQWLELWLGLLQQAGYEL